MKKEKKRIIARLFYGLLSEDYTRPLIRFYAESSEIDSVMTKKMNDSGMHPERFLISQGFLPIDGSIYLLEYD